MRCMGEVMGAVRMHYVLCHAMVFSTEYRHNDPFFLLFHLTLRGCGANNCEKAPIP